MASETTRRVASVFLDDKQAAEALKRLKAEAQNLFKKLETVPEGSKEWVKINNRIVQIQRNMNALSREVKQTSGLFGKLGGNLGALTRTLTGFFAISKVFSVIRDAARVSEEFEAAQSNLGSILGKNRDEIQALTDDAKRYGSTTAFAASQVTELQTELAKLGYTEAEIRNSTKGILNLAAAAGTSLPDAASVAASTMRAFGIDAKDTDKVVDIMAQGLNSTSLSLESFSVGMRVVAPVAKTFGFSLSDTTALLGQLTDAGFDASSAGTALRNILLNLANTNGDLAKELGGNIKSFDEFIPALVKLKEKGVDLNRTLELTDARSVAAFNRFLDASGGALKLRDALDASAGAAGRMAKQQLDNLKGDKMLLQSAWEGFVLSVEDGSGPINQVLRDATKAAAEFLRMLTGASNSPMADAIDEERIAVLRLQQELNNANTTLQRRSEVVQELRDKYPAYFRDLDDEAARILELSSQLNSNTLTLEQRVGIIDELLAKTPAYVSGIDDQSEAVKSLSAELADNATSEQRRHEVITELLVQSPHYFDALDKEKTITDQLNKAVDQLNETMRARAIIMRAEEEQQATVTRASEFYLAKIKEESKATDMLTALYDEHNEKFKTTGSLVLDIQVAMEKYGKTLGFLDRDGYGQLQMRLAVFNKTAAEHEAAMKAAAKTVDDVKSAYTAAAVGAGDSADAFGKANTQMLELIKRRQQFIDAGNEEGAATFNHEIAELWKVVEAHKARGDAAKEAAALEAAGVATTTELAGKLADELKKAQDDIAKDRLGPMQRELADVKKKYDEMRAMAMENETSIAAVEKQREEAIAAIRSKYGQKELERLKKMDDEIRKIRDEQLSANLDAMGKAAVQEIGIRSTADKAELQAIRDRHSMELSAVRGNGQAMAELSLRQRSELEKALADVRHTAEALELQRIKDGYAERLAAVRGEEEKEQALRAQLATELAGKQREQAARADSDRATDAETAAKSYLQLLAGLQQDKMQVTVDGQAAIDKAELDLVHDKYAKLIEAAAGNAVEQKALSDQLAAELASTEQEQLDRRQRMLNTGVEQQRAADAQFIELAQDRLDQLKARHALEQQALGGDPAAQAQLRVRQEEEVQQLLADARAKADERELARIQEQYAARLDAAKGDAGRQADLQIEMDAALATKQQEQQARRDRDKLTAAEDAGKAYQTLNERRQEEIAAALALQQEGLDQAELQRIREKYQKLLEEAKGHKDRMLQLQDLMGSELAAKELDQQRDALQRLADAQAKKDEFDAKVHEEHIAQRDREYDALKERHSAELDRAKEQGENLSGLMQRQWEEEQEFRATRMESDLEQLDAHFEELYASADAAGESTTELQRLHSQAVHLVKEEYAQAGIDLQRRTNEQLNEDEKKAAEERKKIVTGSLSILRNVWTTTGADAEEMATFDKAMTLFSIGMDTAEAISALTAASEANPLNAVTAGGAGVAQWVTGFARITANMAQAAALLSTPEPEAPAFAIGGPTDGLRKERPSTGYTFVGGAGLASNNTGDSEVLKSFWDDQLGTNVTITRPDLSDGGNVTSKTLGWFGEKGPEWVGPNWMYEHPTLEPVFDHLEWIRQKGYVPEAAFAEGGSTGIHDRAGNIAPNGHGVMNYVRFTRGTGIDPLDGGSHGSNRQLAILNESLGRLNDLLDGGIVAALNNDQFVKHKDRLDLIYKDNDITS